MRLGAVVPRVDGDDLAALASNRVSDVRLTVSWSEVQPSAGRWSGAALERVHTSLDTAANAGLRPWLALLGRRTPGWFEDEGGFADAKATGRFWPRYVEGVSDAVGDAVAGWFPIVGPVGLVATAFAGRDPDVVAAGRRTLVVAWRDAWRVLRGGPPVATALTLQPWDADWPRALRTGDPTGAGLELDDLAGAADLLGGIVAVGPRSSTEEPAELLVRLADEGPDRPVVVLAALGGDNDDGRAEAADAVAQAVRLAMGDGVAVEAVFADGLLSADGGPSAALETLAAGVLAA